MYRKIVSLSGGLDSATLLGCIVARKEYEGVIAVGFSYGSKHNVYENRAASAVASWWGIPYRQIDLTPIMLGLNSTLMQGGGAVPEGHYEEETMRKTVVPGRNLVFISILAALAESEGAKEVHLGVHQGDHFIYPDCRPEFICSARQSVHHSTEGKVNLITPFLHMTKAEILALGIKTGGVPYQLTRTCYKDQSIACGKCGSCQERLEAWNVVGSRDPLTYETRDLIPKKSA